MTMMIYLLHTHSVTDSANSASAYATGHKSSASALGVYADSSETPFDDPKVELITELIRRRQPGKGTILTFIVSTCILMIVVI